MRMDRLLAILASPIIFWFLCLDLYERVELTIDSRRDKIFMKRFNLIDEEHVKDLVKWNNNYIEQRRFS